jgi:hypothetical protein
LGGGVHAQGREGGEGPPTRDARSVRHVPARALRRRALARRGDPQPAYRPLTGSAEVASPPTLVVADAIKDQDGHDLLRFVCWDGNPDDEEHAVEAQEFIQKFALTTFKALTFRHPDGRLVAVSAWDKQLLKIAARRSVDAWKLQVIGVHPSCHGTSVANDLAGGPATLRISEYVLRRTYARMQEIDPTRILVVACVSEFNYRSIEACRRVELERTTRSHGVYWHMLGDVDPQIGW